MRFLAVLVLVPLLAYGAANLDAGPVVDEEPCFDLALHGRELDVVRRELLSPRGFELAERLVEEFVRCAETFGPEERERMGNVLESLRYSRSVTRELRGRIFGAVVRARSGDAGGEARAQADSELVSELVRYLYATGLILDTRPLPELPPGISRGEVARLLDEIGSHDDRATGGFAAHARIDWLGIEAMLDLEESRKNGETLQFACAAVRERPGLAPVLERELLDPRTVGGALRAAEFLGEMGAAGRVALLRGLNAEDARLRFLCAEVFVEHVGITRSPADREDCASWLATHGLESLRSNLNSEDADLRAITARLLHDLSLKARACEGLRVYEGVRIEIREAAPELRAAAQDPDPRVRFHAHHALSSLERDEHEALRILARQDDLRWFLPVEALRDLRTDELVALLDGAKPPRGWPGFHDPAWSAVVALCAWHRRTLFDGSHEDLLDELCERILDRACLDASTRPEQELWVLAEVWPPQGHGDQIRANFGYTRGWFASPIPEILRTLEADLPAMRRRAERNVLDAEVPVEVLVDSLRQRWRRRSELAGRPWLRGVRHLDRMPERVVPHVAKLLTHPSPGVRRNACVVLGDHGRTARPWREDLERISRTDDSPLVRTSAELALLGISEEER